LTCSTIYAFGKSGAELLIHEDLFHNGSVQILATSKCQPYQVEILSALIALKYLRIPVDLLDDLCILPSFYQAPPMFAIQTVKGQFGKSGAELLIHEDLFHNGSVQILATSLL
jgi:hypothetical protein